MTQSPPEAPPNAVALGLGGRVNWGTRTPRAGLGPRGRAEGPPPCWLASCGRPAAGHPAFGRRGAGTRSQGGTPAAGGTAPLRPLGARAALEALGSYFF